MLPRVEVRRGLRGGNYQREMYVALAGWKNEDVIFEGLHPSLVYAGLTGLEETGSIFNERFPIRLIIQ